MTPDNAIWWLKLKAKQKQKEVAPIFQGGTLPVTDITAEPIGKGKYLAEFDKQNPRQPYQETNEYIRRFQPEKVVQKQAWRDVERNRLRDNYAESHMIRDRDLNIPQYNPGQTFIGPDNRTDQERKIAQEYTKSVLNPSIRTQIGEAIQKPLRWMADPFKAVGDIVSSFAPNSPLAKDLPNTNAETFEYRKKQLNPYASNKEKINNTFNEAIPLTNWALLNTLPVEAATGNMIKSGKKLIKPVSKVVGKTDDVIKNLPKFKSEIDWSKWNKEIPENKTLMQEYNTIEEMLNKTKSFGINPATNKPYKVDINVPKEIDIVLRSKNFKKSFPDFNFDTDIIHRGERYARKTYINKDKPTDVVFGTSDFAGAIDYLKHQNTEDVIHPHKIDELFKKYNIKEDEFLYNDGTVGGINVLAIPNKSKTLRVDAKNNQFTMLPNHLKLNQEYVKYNTENLKNNIKIFGKDEMKIPKDYSDSKLYASTDNYASALNDGLKDYNRVLVENVYDGINKPITDHIINPRNTSIKSIFYNNGMFDMSNPNIYKGLITPVFMAAYLNSKTNKDEKSKR